MGNEETELELSVESRSFVNRVNDQVRKRQKRISNVAGDGAEHPMVWWMFMAVTMESAVFMGKNFQNNHNSIVNTADLTLKQMFDRSTRLVAEQDEISGLETIDWENHSWKYLSLIGDERIINLQRTKVQVFSDSVLCLGKIFENPEFNEHEEQRLGWIKSSQNYRNFDRIDGEPTEFEWNIFPGFDTLQLSEELKRLLLRSDETPDISCATKRQWTECLANARLVSLCARRFGKRQCNLLVLVVKKWSIKEDSPQGIWDKIAERMLEFAESGCPIFRATTPPSRSQPKSKGHGKLSIHFAVVQETIETFASLLLQTSLVFTEQSKRCVKNTNPFTEEWGDLLWWDNQVPHSCSVQSRQMFLSRVMTQRVRKILLQQYGERNERLPQQDKLCNFCMDAGFLSVVENGHYFMTKDTAQFNAMASCEYTLPREDGLSQPRGWIQGNTKIGPVLEVTTSCLQGKHGVEIRICSLNGDNTHSWVRFSLGSNKFVMELNNNGTEIPEEELEEYTLQLSGSFLEN